MPLGECGCAPAEQDGGGVLCACSVACVKSRLRVNVLRGGDRAYYKAPLARGGAAAQHGAPSHGGEVGAVEQQVTQQLKGLQPQQANDSVTGRHTIRDKRRQPAQSQEKAPEEKGVQYRPRCSRWATSGERPPPTWLGLPPDLRSSSPASLPTAACEPRLLWNRAQSPLDQGSSGAADRHPSIPCHSPPLWRARLPLGDVILGAEEPVVIAEKVVVLSLQEARDQRAVLREKLLRGSRRKTQRGC